MRQNCRRESLQQLTTACSAQVLAGSGSEQSDQGTGGEWKEKTLAQLAGTPSSVTSNHEDQMDETSPHSLKTIQHSNQSPLKQCQRRTSAFVLGSNSKLLLTQDKKLKGIEDFIQALTLIKNDPIQGTPLYPISPSLSEQQMALITHFQRLTQHDRVQRKIHEMDGRVSVCEFLKQYPEVERFGDLMEEMRRGEEKLESQRGILDGLIQLQSELLGGTHPDCLPTNTEKIKAKVERLLICVRETSRKDYENQKMTNQTCVKELSQFKQVLQFILNSNIGLLREYISRLHPQIATLCEKISVQLQKRGIKLDTLYSRLIAVQPSENKIYSLQSVRSQPIDSKIDYCMQLTRQIFSPIFNNNSQKSYKSQTLLPCCTSIEELMTKQEKKEIKEDQLSARLDMDREILLQMEQIYEWEQTNANLIAQKQNLQQKLSNLKTQQQLAQLQLNQHQHKLASISAEFQACLNENKTIRMDNSNLQQLLASICDLNDTLQNQFTIVSQENRKLKATAICMEEENTQLKQQICSSTHNVQVVEKQKMDCMLKAEEIQSKLSQAYKLIEYEKKLKKLQSNQINQIKETIMQLKSSLSNYQEKKKRNQQMQVELKTEINNIRQENILISTKLINESAISKLLKQQNVELTAQIIRINQQVHDKIAEITQREAIIANRQSILMQRQANLVHKETALVSKQAEILATTTQIVHMTAKLEQTIQSETLFKHPPSLHLMLPTQSSISTPSEEDSQDEKFCQSEIKKSKLQLRHCRSMRSLQDENELTNWMGQDSHREGQMQELRKALAAKDKLINRYEMYLEKYRGEARKSRLNILEMKGSIGRLEAELSWTRQELLERKEQKGGDGGSHESESCVNLVEKEVELKVKEEQLNCKIEEIIKHVLQLNSLKIQVTALSASGSAWNNPEHCL